jgi:hypothetical protein
VTCPPQPPSLFGRRGHESIHDVRPVESRKSTSERDTQKGGNGHGKPGCEITRWRNRNVSVHCPDDSPKRICQRASCCGCRCIAVHFREKEVVVRSLDPGDPDTVDTTVVTGDGEGPVVTFSTGEASGCRLLGLTISGGTVGVSCGNASPAIQNCTVACDGPVAVEFADGFEPTIVDCAIQGQVKATFSPGLIAYWKLDETEGDMAHESIADNHGDLVNGPVWQPASGAKGGGLLFDGLDDYVGLPFILNPAKGPFRVIAWIKGGQPGQVFMSQQEGANWLSADPSHGNLMTALNRPRRGVATFRRLCYPKSVSPMATGTRSVSYGMAISAVSLLTMCWLLWIVTGRAAWQAQTGC